MEEKISTEIAREVAGRRTDRRTGVEDTELLLPQASSKAHEGLERTKAPTTTGGGEGGGKKYSAERERATLPRQCAIAALISDSMGISFLY